MRALLRAVLVTAAVIAGIPAPAHAAGTLRIGMTQFPSTMHPMIDAMLAKSYVLAMTAPPIVHYDHEWKAACKVCVELPGLDNGLATLETTEGTEGMAVTYRLHPDATWGDGVPVSTDDVVFAWEVGRHPQSGVTNGDFFRRITRLEVVDEKTFTAHIDKVYFDYPMRGIPSLLPAHLDRAVFEAEPAEYRHRSTFDADPANPGLAFGPYRVTSLERGAEIVLERNPTWYGKAPHFDRIVVRTIENTAALEANLLSGAIDMIAGELGLTLDQALAFEKRHGARFDVVFKPGLIYEHIDLNLDNPLLADARTRRALLHAVDREAISEQLFAGKQPVAHSNVNPLDWVYSDAVPRYPYDPERAAALLDEAGWKASGRGPRRNAAGEELVLEIMTTAGNRSRELVQQVLQGQWRELGIEVRIRNEPARVFFGETVSKRRFSAMAMFAWVSSPEAVPRTTLHSSQISTEENAWSGQNKTGFSNARVDALIDAMEVELDRDRRLAMWAELQRIYAEELPVLPLYWRANAFVLPRWLRGLRPTGHQFTSSLWVEEWHRAE